MKTTIYKLKNNKINNKLRIALVSDLHGAGFEKIVSALEKSEPDIIAVTGDITSRLDATEGEIPPNDYGRPISHNNAFGLLSECARIAPTFYSLGNHELCGHKYRENHGRKCRDENLRLIKESGAVLLDDGFAEFEGIRIGGLTSGLTNSDLAPKTDWIDDFEKTDAFKLLLCHHPEYYPAYLKKRDIDLVLSGHAHGGQIVLFGRGLFAPGQGVLPKYTAGTHDGRFVISRGLCNTAKPIPRLFNPREIVIIDIEKS